MRRATYDDIPRIVDMGKDFCQTLGERYNEESIISTLTAMIDQDSAVLLVGEHSMAGAVVAPHFFDVERTMATELFWWVDPEYRGKGEGIAILNELESWARFQGADRISMIAMSSLDPRVEEIYGNHGYRTFETMYVKEL